jgi:cell division protein FtsN
MSLVTIEDQSPTMRRAKMRVVLAIVLIIVAIGCLVSMSRNSPGKTDVATQQPIKTPPAPATPVAHAVVASKLEQVKAPAPPSVKADVAPEAKPPQAPPDPVYTSFTADAAYVAANTPAVAPVEADMPASIPVKPAAAVQSKPVEPARTEEKAKAEEKIAASAGGQYLLQAGVFAEMENAKRQLEKLAQHHIDTHIESKVRIGPFASTGDVDGARDKVKAAGIYTTLDEFTSSKGVMLQGLLTDMESAKQLQAKLSEIGLTSRCETRILIGPFDTKAKADMVRNRIKALNISVVLL